MLRFAIGFPNSLIYIEGLLMKFSGIVRPLLRTLPLALLSNLGAIGIAMTASAQNLPAGNAPVITPEQAAEGAELKSVGVLSIPGGQRLMGEAGSAVSSGNYALAVKKLQEARQVLNQTSNFYQQLGNNFAGIDSRISDNLRKKAVDAAQMRDEATYQLALAHRALNQPELSVPLLVQVINSQNPTRELGKKSYAQLVELGFADTPYPRSTK